MAKETQIIILRWFDSSVGGATAVYSTKEMEDEKLVVLETIGWLISETEEPYGGAYKVAASKHGEDWRGMQLIPKANVISLSRFSEADLPLEMPLEVSSDGKAYLADEKGVKDLP